MSGVERLAQAAVNLDAWLQTMRQPGGYGGPVAHWWQNRMQYTGPGLDWRYEGLLVGSRTLYDRTSEERWRTRALEAAGDLLRGQNADGSYRASQFEMNPGVLGTPHEAAATLGLLHAAPLAPDPEQLLRAARRNLDNIIKKLWDGQGFNDRPGITGRVPNKLATLAQAFLTFGTLRDDRYQPFARAALDDVLRYQEPGGEVHQYAPGAGRGDGRFFPYYNARCIPPLVQAAHLLQENRYLVAARAILDFLTRTMTPGGTWPQIVYQGEQQAHWPRWVAGTADILLAYRALGVPLPDAALDRLLSAQLGGGGFPTAVGFGRQIAQRGTPQGCDYRDCLPVVGWNDKVWRLLATLLPPGTALPPARVNSYQRAVTAWGQEASFHESPLEMRIETERGLLLRWRKQDPWAHVAAALEVR